MLFLDEVCEFGGQRLESLRTVLEEGEVRIARVKGAVSYPARFQLVLATNPCPCAPPKEADCTCSATARRRYLGRLSGPLLDRVDLRVRLRPLTAISAHETTKPEPTEVVRERVLSARERAVQRWEGQGWRANSEVPGPVHHPPWMTGARAQPDSVCVRSDPDRPPPHHSLQRRVARKRARRKREGDRGETAQREDAPASRHTRCCRPGRRPAGRRPAGRRLARVRPPG